MARSRSLTIRLIKSGTRANEIFKAEQELHSVALRGGLSFEGSVYFKPSVRKPPSWVNFLNSGTEQPIANLFGAQASALMLIRTRKARFAISFGHSWQWLNEDVAERRFGLVTALNCIEDDQIKLVDAQQIDSLALNRRAQASHSSELISFGLDIRRDLMKAIVGRPKSKDVGRSIMGADALRITSRIEFAEIGKKCDQLFDISRNDEYKTNYGWIDNIEVVKAPSEKRELDALLVHAINSGETDRLFLARPRISDIAAEEEYRFHFDKGPEENRPDIEFDDLRDGIRSALPINLEYLKTHRISVYAAGGTAPVDSFNIYSGIVFETTKNHRLFCLIDGDWYKISEGHVEFVNRRAAQIAKSKIKLPKARSKEKESDYNIRAANDLGASCMDRRMVIYGGGANKIEVCDILTNSPALIHVKRASSSQLLSHLFNQGVISGQFLLDEDFRKECSKKADDAYKAIFASPYSAAKVTIVFGIISKNADKLPDKLPFFSKQSLVNAADLLRKFNYKIELRGIDVS